MKKIFDADQFPTPLKGELTALLASLKGKYGAQNVRMGLHIQNLATLVGMVGDTRMDDATRATAAEHAKEILMGVLKELGSALNADPTAAFAVAGALADFTGHAETELLGEQPMPSTVTEEAADILARAAGHGGKPTVH